MTGQRTHRSPPDPASTGLQRKRVAKACHPCRSMKSKCDGKWPECSRCKGYGYSCVYGAGRRNHYTTVAAAESSADNGGTSRGQTHLRAAIRQYELLLDSVLSQLPSSKDRQDANAVLASMNAAYSALSGVQAETASPEHKSAVIASASALKQPLSQAERFLGEISDVRFFNLVKQVFQNRLGSEDHPSVESYEQDGDIPSPPVAPSRVINLPSPENIKAFTDVYFTTVHLAFPFIPQAPFMRSLEKAMDPVGDASLTNTTLATIYVICAIGAYYTSLPGSHHEDTSHEVYYLQALSLAPPSGTDRSIDHVCLLLAQCFYLLAVCRTDSCWMVLGQTVRMAQSIGLHAEKDDAEAAGKDRLLLERRRRVWSCIYVLDRLASLQLGRPPAIHEEYCRISLPSRISDSNIDWQGSTLPESFIGPSTGDYHIALISFSDIVGQVLREQCSPKAKHDLASELLRTKELDRQISQWKHSLPRTLRFDLGHAFEKNFIFKRQRSMFAIKYHHLRALICRPYLCYPVLRNLNDNSDATFAQINWPLVSMYERTCITEARETARLLHSISSEIDLVQDFPWWQMISCLILAGSILLVSSIFTQQTENVVVDGLDAASICDDAETCLRVFEALSANSTGARIARDMMERLKEYGQLWRTQVVAAPHFHVADAQDCRPSSSEDTLPACSADSGIGGSNAGGLGEDAPVLLVPTPSAWPPELVDSMAWSSQFLGAVQPKEQL